MRPTHSGVCVAVCTRPHSRQAGGQHTDTTTGTHALVAAAGAPAAGLSTAASSLVIGLSDAEAAADAPAAAAAAVVGSYT